MGPLPATVYWRRRLAAIASAATVIVLLVWGVAALATRGAPDDDATARPASHAAVSAPQQASPSPAAPPPAAPPGAAGSEAPQPTDEPTTSPPPTFADPVPCTNDMLAVTAEVERPEYRVGERLLLRLVVTNTSDQPCVRDLDPVRREIAVWSGDGSERLWSSNDCSTAKGEDLRTLEPGEPLASAVRWVGRTSAPGCPEKRETVPAGEYRLMSRVDDVVSAPTSFVRTP